jgi:putative effector of murein hydrolase LrgA (UPF0299 family)
MSNPARLHKKEEKNMEAWILSHAYIFLPLCIIILLILFVWLCFAVTGVSAVESGTVYNHMMDVI